MSTTSIKPLTLADVAAMDLVTFIATFGGIFEHSPWVAEAAWKCQPFANEVVLHDAMMNAVRTSDMTEKVKFLKMHPQLAGSEAQAGTMTEHSSYEQSGAGLNALNGVELLTLRNLNATYLARHGFPFVIAVLNHTKPQIFAALQARIANDTSSEIDAALEQISAITWRRLNMLLTRSDAPRQEQ